MRLMAATFGTGTGVGCRPTTGAETFWRKPLPTWLVGDPLAIADSALPVDRGTSAATDADRQL